MNDKKEDRYRDMSNTIAHLAVARELLKKCPNLIHNERAYYLGTLAPDTIGGKPDYKREDKKKVHLREDIPDSKWLEPELMALFTERVNAFAQEYIVNESDADQRDFNIGYWVHLLTDKYNHEIIRQKLLKKTIERGVVSSVWEFYHSSGHDESRHDELEALDSYLLESHPELGDLFSELTSKEIDYCLPGWIEKQYIKNSILWWNNHYLPGIKEQELLYLATEDMEEFITYSVGKIAEELNVVVWDNE